MKTIVIGVDGSSASLDALSWADGIAGRTRATLVAVRAGLPGTAVPPPLAAHRADEARHELGMWCKERDLAGTPELVVSDEDPRTALVAVAAERDADLLVAGTRGTGVLAGLLLGGVAQHLVQHPVLPLALVPSGVDAVTRHVVVGVDGSDGSLAAVRFSAGFAGALDIGVTAVLAQDPFAEWVPASDPQSWQRRAQRQVGGWVEPVVDAGVRVRVVVDRDVHPVAALARALETRPGSVAVVGARGRGGFPGLRLGRVPLHLLHQAGVPVVVVPTQTR
jgi:nucleotide-binding universal stress UspA family protein